MITRWRITLIAALVLLPLAVCVVLGMFALYVSGVFLWVSWMFPICWGSAYLVARSLRRSGERSARQLPQPPNYWTQRDSEAWDSVEAQQEALAEISPQQLTDAHFYLQSAMDLGLKLAKHYHPKASDPISSLTVTEIVAAAQLAIEDSARWIDEFVPGSRLLTVGQWKTLGKTPRWFRRISNIVWAGRLLAQPSDLGRFLSTRLAADSTVKHLRGNVSAWVYLAFIRHVGFYLIEMNSGRLRGGATKYRASQREAGLLDDRSRNEDARADSTSDAAMPVAIALVGQVNAGKSSIINALLEERRAAVDVLPKTQHVTRYRLDLPDSAHALILLDTPGYGAAGATHRQRDETGQALKQADLILLVMDATNPSRKPDLQILEWMKSWYEGRCELKRPPALGVLTHIDGLSPALEWNPPYHWKEPSCAKGESIAAAVKFNQTEFSQILAGVVPVCSDFARQRTYGVHEWLLPSIISLLDEARACTMLRSLHRDMDGGQLQVLFRQLSSAGMALLKHQFVGDAKDANPGHHRPPSNQRAPLAH